MIKSRRANDKPQRKRAKMKVGAPPGQMIYTGSIQETDPEISIIRYNSDFYEESLGGEISIKDIKVAEDTVVWVNLNGLSNIELIKEIQATFNLNKLAVEDALSVGQRAKFDSFTGHCSFINQILHLQQPPLTLHSEQISVFWGHHFVVTFQEKEEDVLRIIRKRLKEKIGRIRGASADYLAYAVIDAVVDSNLILALSLEDRVESSQREMRTFNQFDLEYLFEIRSRIFELRRVTTPAREALGNLIDSNSPYIATEHKEYFTDVKDHATSTIDSLNSLKEELTSFIELKIALLSHKNNQIVHLLTVVSTVFIPLTFLSSIYGMNFTVMPELNHPYGYYILWGVMLVLVAVQIVYFKSKRWL